MSSDLSLLVAASQAGREVVYLREKPTEIWEDNASCIMMSENPTNRDRSRHVDVKVQKHREYMWCTLCAFFSFL
jgi:hypothetical protein